MIIRASPAMSAPRASAGRSGRRRPSRPPLPMPRRRSAPTAPAHRWPLSPRRRPRPRSAKAVMRAVAVTGVTVVRMAMRAASAVSVRIVPTADGVLTAAIAATARNARTDRPDRAARGDRPDRDPDLRAKYIKGRGEGRDRRDRQPDPNSPFAKLAALKEQLEASSKEPR